MQLLLIKINAIDTNPDYALLGKKQKQDSFTTNDWEKVRSHARGRRVLLVIPNEDVVLTSVKIPSKNKKQLLKAVPYALEDTLADDIEELHFAIHQADSEGETQVAVINRKLLDSYLSLLRKHNITPHFVLPQVLTQKIQKESWSILQGDDSAVSIRINDFYGFSCEQSLLELFINQLEEPEPKSILTNLQAEELPEALRSYPLEAIDAKKVSYDSVSKALPLNLLTNFISQRKHTSINWKAWKPTLVIASVVAIAWLGILGWQNTLLKKQQKQLQQSINNVYLSAFPGGRLVDPPQQMKSKLLALKKSVGATVNSPLPLISDIAPLLIKYKDLTLSEIRYRENKLELVVKAPNITRLEVFKKEAMTKAGLKVNINSSTTTADKVEAVLLVSPLNSSGTDQGKA